MRNLFFAVLLLIGAVLPVRADAILTYAGQPLTGAYSSDVRSIPATVSGATAVLDLTCAGLCDGSFVTSDVSSLNVGAVAASFSTSHWPYCCFTADLTIADGVVTSWNVGYSYGGVTSYSGAITSGGDHFSNFTGAPTGYAEAYFSNGTPGTWTVNVDVPGPVAGTGLPGLLLLGAFWLSTKTGLGASRHPASKA
jgi:hypothetical protein